VFRRLGTIARALWRFRVAFVIAASMALLGPSTAFAAGVWSAPAPVDPAIDAQSVSCPSASFCVAVGLADSFGSAAVYNGSTWSEASLIDTRAQLFSVSCPSSSFCMATDGVGDAFTYNGSTWSAPSAIGAILTSVSCASSSFCVAV